MTKGERVIQDKEIGTVTFRKSARCRRVGIRVHPVRGVTVSVPCSVPYAFAETFFRLKRDWVVDALEKQKKRAERVHKATPAEIETLRTAAKAELPPRLKVLAERYGFTYNRVTIKHNATNWGSCSAKGNINLNLSLVRLPQPLVDYVLLHELCHLRHQDHGRGFHLLLEHLCTDNLLKYADEGDVLALRLAKAAAASGATYPLDNVMTKEMKKYGIIHTEI